MLKRSILVLCASQIAMLAGPARAQEAPRDGAPQKATELDGQIGDIVVTARKRSERLQDVPTSLTAVSSDQIARINAKSLRDLNGIVPNATVGDRGELTIRGIASNARNAGFEAGAAVYIDGVYQGRPTGNNQDLVDIERIEVLRGPQGTLYGKNTTAGAISLVTARPGERWTGRAEVQYAERNDRRVSGYVAGPLIPEILGVKVAGFRRLADGYQTNSFDNDRYGNIDSAGMRGELRLTPPGWDIALRGDFLNDDSAATVGRPVTGFAAPTSPTHDVVSENRTHADRVRSNGASLTIQHGLDGGYDLVSISALRTLRTNDLYDLDSSPLDIAYTRFTDRSRQFSQEVRIASPAGDRFTWVLGGFYFFQRLNTDRPVTLGAAFPIQAELNDIVETRTHAYAAFANADFRIVPKFTLSGGLRFTSETKALEFQQFGVPALGYPNLRISDRFTDHDLSPTVALTYTPTGRVTTYLRFARGFKSGGWNPDITTSARIRFNAEKVTNYEAGVKTQLFDRHVAVNIAAFSMDYDDLQVSQFLGNLVGYVVTNAGRARIRGVEGDIEAKPTNWLTLSAGGAYNDAKYRNFDSGTGVNYAGQQFTNVPKFSGFVAADAKIPLDGLGAVTLHGDARYRGNVFFDDRRTVSPVGPYAADGTTTINARIGVQTTNGIEVSLFVDNLTDKRALINRASDTIGIGQVTERYARPRQFGARAGFSF